MLYFLCISPSMGKILEMGGKKISCDPLFSSTSCRWGLSYWSFLKMQVLLFFVHFTFISPFFNLPSNCLCRLLSFNYFCNTILLSFRCTSWQLPSTLVWELQGWDHRWASPYLQGRLLGSQGTWQLGVLPSHILTSVFTECEVPWRDWSIKAAWCIAATKGLLAPLGWLLPSSGSLF